MPIHHHFKKGQKVLVRLVTGEDIVDRYLETKANYLVLEQNKIKWEDIQFTTIYKNRI